MVGLEGNTLDRYQLQKLIGRGGMADVYLAYDPRFERDVAVKVFKRDDEELLKRFIREARLMASLANPHLMSIYDAGTARLDGNTHYFIVMPFMDGGTLRARIRRSPLSLREACRCLRVIANALDYMHDQGIIHRDIKSSNVLLDADGRCYLSDFGIARTSSENTQMTSTGSVLGTVDYIAPELFEVNRKADARSDLYSLGVLLFEMVTGHLPFEAENQFAVIAMHMGKSPPLPHTFVPTISPQVERVMLKALEKRPELRYGSATALSEAFCRSISSRQSSGEHTGYPLREQLASASPYTETEREYPSTPSPTRSVRPETENAARPQEKFAPAVRSATGYRSRPPQQQRRRPTSPSRARMHIVTVLGLLVLLAVTVPVVY
ncbi:MAG TPA: protein kinase, partial [Ktedonobacteraceae bacterium]|nr:protein kinase [Ktedonobacteraceae bacterium]